MASFWKRICYWLGKCSQDQPWSWGNSLPASGSSSLSSPSLPTPQQTGSHTEPGVSWSFAPISTLLDPRDSLQSQDEAFVPDPLRIWILTLLLSSSFQHLMSLQPESSPELWLHRTQHLTWPFDFSPFWINSAHPENSTEAKMGCAGIEERNFLLGSVGPTSNSVCLSLSLSCTFSLAAESLSANEDCNVCPVNTQVHVLSKSNKVLNVNAV